MLTSDLEKRLEPRDYDKRPDFEDTPPGNSLIGIITLILMGLGIAFIFEHLN